MESIRQVQLNSKAGMTFPDGLRSILRQDPDVVMVGEIRDSETAKVAAQAALTGHMVFSTVHTNDAAGAITRLIDMGIAPFLVSSVLLAVIAQRLVRRVCPYCKEPYQPTDDELKFWGVEKANQTEFITGKGCKQCLNSGYKGRIGFFEILYIDDSVREMIINGVSANEITNLTTASGQLTTLKMDAVQKIMDGDTSLKEANSVIMIK